jgi:hypothetical protein
MACLSNNFKCLIQSPKCKHPPFPFLLLLLLLEVNISSGETCWITVDTPPPVFLKGGNVAFGHLSFEKIHNMFTIAAFGFTVENGSRYDGGLWSSLLMAAQITAVSKPTLMLRERPCQGPSSLVLQSRLRSHWDPQESRSSGFSAFYQ